MSGIGTFWNLHGLRFPDARQSAWCGVDMHATARVPTHLLRKRMYILQQWTYMNVLYICICICICIRINTQIGYVAARLTMLFGLLMLRPAHLLMKRPSLLLPTSWTAIQRCYLRYHFRILSRLQQIVMGSFWATTMTRHRTHSILCWPNPDFSYLPLAIYQWYLLLSPIKSPYKYNYSSFCRILQFLIPILNRTSSRFLARRKSWSCGPKCLSYPVISP